MSRLAVLYPTTLLGKELLDGLAERPDLTTDLRLLSLDVDEVGQLADAAGTASLVAAADADEIEAADVVVVCGALAPYRRLLESRRADATLVLLSPDAGIEDGTPVVAGVNLDAVRRGEAILSPHPGAVLLAHLLHPLVPHGLAAAVATVVQPVSVYDRPGLDELFAQAGRMVAMQSQAPSKLFGGRQLAFNLYPAGGTTGGLTAQLRSALGEPAAALALSVTLLQGAVFHGFSAVVHVEMAGGSGGEGGDEPSEVELRERLAENQLIELYEPAKGKGERLGPIDVPAHDRVLVGPVARDPEASGGRGGYWIWAVMDNLTRGGAANALAILERVG